MLKTSDFLRMRRSLHVCTHSGSGILEELAGNSHSFNTALRGLPLKALFRPGDNSLNLTKTE